MTQIGTLRTWYDDRGFGFITPSDGGRELFVHISAFPRDGFRPIVGETLRFEVGPGKDGKQQAIRIQRRAVWDRLHYPRRRIVKSGSKRSVFVATLLVVALGAFGYSKYQQAEPQTNQQAEPQTYQQAEPQTYQQAEPQTTKQQLTKYRCDGRKRCPQMTSCAEAKFFLANCPGAEMDGDSDGIPCEQQWCTSSK